MKKLFWGLFFLLSGATIIISSLGYMGDINLLTLILTIFLVAIIITSIRHLHFGGIFVPIAVILILFDKQLGITSLTPWPILITSIFISIGFEILFKKYTFKLHNNHTNKFSDDIGTINNSNDETVSVSVSFNSSIRYVNANNFKRGNFECSFGSLKVYFDNTTIDKDGAIISVSTSFGETQLFIPKGWNVINNIKTSLAEVEENGRCDINGPTVVIKGDVSLGSIEITYV